MIKINSCLIIVSLLLIKQFSFAQTPSNSEILPLDKEFNKILYTDVVQAGGFSAKKLFQNAKNWLELNKEGNYPMVTTSENPDKNTLFGMGGFMIPTNSKRIECIYSVKLFIKDGRYKYELIDFIMYHNTHASSQSGGFGYFKKGSSKDSESFEYSLETFYPLRLTEPKQPEVKHFSSIDVETFKYIANEVKAIIGSLALEMKRNDDW